MNESYKSPRALVQRVRCMAIAHSEQTSALEVAKNIYGQRRDSNVVEILQKAAVGSLGTSGLGSELYPLRQTEIDFADSVRPLTVAGKLQYTPVPLATPLPYLTTKTIFRFVEERERLPAAAPAFGTNILLNQKKIGGILVVSKELLKHSEGETILQREMVSACAEAIDLALLDPAATVTAARPASITSEAATVFQGTGVDTAAEIDGILSAMLAEVIGLGSTLEKTVWITTPINCTELAQKRTTGGNLAFPGVTARGGVLHGLPLIASASCPSDELVLVDGGELLVADEGETTVEITEQATIQQDDEPSGATNLVSMFQTDSIGVRIVRTVNWELRRKFVTRCTNFQLSPASAATTS